MIGLRPWLLVIPVAVFFVALLGDALGLPTRQVASVLILAIAPGAAITWLAGVRDKVAWMALVVPVSLSVDLVVGSTLVYIGLWSGTLAFAIVCLITAIALALVPFERGARVALIAVALLPTILLLAPELDPQPEASRPAMRAEVIDSRETI